MMAIHNMSSRDDVPDPVKEDEYHRQIAVIMAPGIVILGLLMLLGFFGNTLVLYIYSFRLKRTPTHLFITALAVSDIVVCSVCIPIEIVVMRYLFSFDKPWLCKVMRTVVLWCVVSSVSVLIAIAVDRYKRICTPFAIQITAKTAKIAIGIGCIVAAVLASPSMVILGSKTVNKTLFIGHSCATDDSMIPTPYPGLFNGLQIIIAIVSTSAVTILYILILRKIKAQEKYKSGVKVQMKEHKHHALCFENRTPCSSEAVVDTAFSDDSNPPWVTTPTSDLSVGESEKDHYGQRMDKNVTAFPDDDTDVLDESANSPRNSSDSPETAVSESKVKAKVLCRTYKTTFMMFLITAVFIISFIPHLGLMATRAAQKHTFGHLEGAPLGLYNLFLRSYFINSASNPIIYSFLSDKFRKEVKILFGRSPPKTTAV